MLLHLASILPPRFGETALTSRDMFEKSLKLFIDRVALELDMV